MSDTIVLLEEETISVVVAQEPTVVVVSAPGPQGPRGVSGGDFVVHEQTSAADIWTIDHNMGRVPSYYAVESTGDELEPDRSDPTLNQTIFDFSGVLVSGTAYLS